MPFSEHRFSPHRAGSTLSGARLRTAGALASHLPPATPVFQLTAVALAFVLATGFALASARVIARAERAEADSAARHRFLAAFDARGAVGRPPADLLVQTYETLARRLGDGRPRQALRPGARLATDLGLGAADLEDVALLVAARCDARIPHARDLDALHHEAETVEQLVGFLGRFVEAEGAEAAAVRAA